MRFKDVLNEMPHVEILKGKYIDFKAEDNHNWLMDDLTVLFKKYKGKEKEISERLLKNISFINIFKKEVEKLSSSDNKKLTKLLPDVFWKVYKTNEI